MPGNLFQGSEIIEKIMSRILFLGSGGGRWSTIFQARATGGFRIELSDDKIHVDPGPGAIVKCTEFKTNPRSTNAVIVTHCHLDHFNDARVMVEAMSMSRKRGIFAGSKSVIEGYDNFSPVLDKYHTTLPNKVVKLEPGTELKLNNCKVRATTAKHADPTTVGLQFDTEYGKISHITDTEYFSGLAKEHSGCRIAIINLMRPGSDRIPYHLCTEDAIQLVKELNPEIALFQHFGLKLLRAGPESEVKKIAEETGIECVAVTDGYEYELAHGTQKSLSDFEK